MHELISAVSGSHREEIHFLTVNIDNPSAAKDFFDLKRMISRRTSNAFVGFMKSDDSINFGGEI